MSRGLRIVTALVLAHAPVAAAAEWVPPFPDQQTQEQWKEAEERARKGVQELLQSLELFKDALPDYGLPYVDSDGDIVIPRKWRRSPHRGTPVPAPRPERT